MSKLLGSYLITTICSWTLSFLVPLHVLKVTGSASWTSLAYLAAMAPYLLVTPFAGVWGDRYSKKTLLIAGDLLNILTGLSIYYCMNAGGDAGYPGVLVLLNFILASTSATHHPIFQGFAPQVLQPGTLKKFNSMISAIDSAVRGIAPVLAALLLSVASMNTVLITCALGYFLSLPLLLRVRNAPASSRRDAGLFRELSQAMRYVLSDANLVAFSLLFLCVNFGLAIVGANLVYIYSALLEVPQQHIGYHYGLIGVGAIAGSFVAPKLIDSVSDATLIVGSCAAAGVLTLLAGFSAAPWMLSVIWAVVSACISVIIVTFFTFRQRVVPQDILSRTVAITRWLSFLAIPPASVLGGILMERTQSLAMVFTCGGLAITLGSLIALGTPVIRAQMLSRHTEVPAQIAPRGRTE